MTKDQKLLYDQVTRGFRMLAPTDLMNTEKERGAGEQHWLLVKSIHKAMKSLSITTFYEDCIPRKGERSVD